MTYCPACNSTLVRCESVSYYMYWHSCPDCEYRTPHMIIPLEERRPS